MKLLSTSLPKALHQGHLLIGDIKLECAVLDNGLRVLTANSILKAFGSSAIEINSKLEVLYTKLPIYLAKNNLDTYITQYFIYKYKPITYLYNKQKKIAYDADILPKLCDLYLKARRNGNLHTTQVKLAIRSEILLSALAQVGVSTLVDEATGYQFDRKHEALRILLFNYIPVEFQKLLELISDNFYSELDWFYFNSLSKSKSIKRPQVYARFIKKYIFEETESEYIKKYFSLAISTANIDCKTKLLYWLSREGQSLLLYKIHVVEELIKKFPNIKSFRIAMSKQKHIISTNYNYDLYRMIG